MQIHPEQLVPGCILLEQVTGKSKNPLITKNTVIKEQHILVLQHFGIDSVVVAHKLQDGAPFKPTPFQKEDIPKQDIKNGPASFNHLYVEAVQNYKVIFHKWQGGTPIDFSTIRKIMMPLIEHVCQYNLDLFLLHKYATKKNYFYHHAVAVAILSIFIAKRSGYKKKDLIKIGLTAILADCGMTQIQESVYKTDKEITRAEFEEIKKHPTYSYRMVKNIPSITKEMKLGILQHHERSDGSGYPLGVREDKIHPFAKIITISDTYHAMTSERMYRNKQSPFKVLEEMLDQKYSKFDYPLLNTFVHCLMNYSIGTRIKLSTGKNATIIFVNDKNPTRPLIRLEGTSEIIELSEQTSIFIEDIIKS